MSIFQRLAKRQEQGQVIQVAVVGAGLIGRGTVRQVAITPGMRPALIVARRAETGVEAYAVSGFDRSTIVVSDDLATLQGALDAGRPAVTTRLEMIRDLGGLDVAVEVTGAVEYGAQMAINAIEGGKHVVMMNAETDVTVGCALKQMADEAGLVYTNSDGDQPGVLMRMIEYVRGIGLEIVAAVNCKGFMDIHATPDSIREWAVKQNTSLAMTTAFTDGTKMNIENAVLCNASGLIPAQRGMHGVKTDMPTALADCMKVFTKRGIVDYTLGGSFGGGVFVIGHGVDPVMLQPYLKYLKMGPGPDYLFYRPWHLCHFETPLSIAEAVLDHEPTIAPLGAPVVEVIAIAKKDMAAGETLDGIGGFCTYGQIETAAKAKGLLPVGLSAGAKLTKPFKRGEAIAMTGVELDHQPALATLRARQDKMH